MIIFHTKLIDKTLVICFIACLFVGMILCFAWLTTAAYFDPPGNFWAGLVLALAAPLSPVVWIILRRYKALRLNTDPQSTGKVFLTAGFIWVAALLFLTCMAYAKWSPLTYALRHDYKPLTAMLLKAELAVNKRDFEGETPLGLAIRAGDQVMVKQLIEHGADVNLPIVVRQPRTSTKYMPLKLAILKHDPEMIELLRKAGAKEQIDR